jgi:hypothetical protein
LDERPVLLRMASESFVRAVPADTDNMSRPFSHSRDVPLPMGSGLAAYRRYEQAILDELTSALLPGPVWTHWRVEDAKPVLDSIEIAGEPPDSEVVFRYHSPDVPDQPLAQQEWLYEDAGDDTFDGPFSVAGWLFSHWQIGELDAVRVAELDAPDAEVRRRIRHLRDLGSKEGTWRDCPHGRPPIDIEDEDVRLYERMIRQALDQAFASASAPAQPPGIHLTPGGRQVLDLIEVTGERPQTTIILHYHGADPPHRAVIERVPIYDDFTVINGFLASPNHVARRTRIGWAATKSYGWESGRTAQVASTNDE